MTKRTGPFNKLVADWREQPDVLYMNCSMIDERYASELSIHHLIISLSKINYGVRGGQWTEWRCSFPIVIRQGLHVRVNCTGSQKKTSIQSFITRMCTTVNKHCHTNTITDLFWGRWRISRIIVIIFFFFNQHSHDKTILASLPFSKDFSISPRWSQIAQTLSLSFCFGGKLAPCGSQMKNINQQIFTCRNGFNTTSPP